MLQTLNCRGRLIDLRTPVIMGVLNLTPDSFSDGGMFNSVDAALRQTENLLNEGAKIVDIGGYSSRPGAEHVSETEELERVLPITQRLLTEFPEAVFSIDTFRSRVAMELLEAGVHLVNDISGGKLDSEMDATVARYGSFYICMHMQGTPQTMQENPEYKDVLEDIFQFFVRRIRELKAAGIRDIVLDPGFGFGKTLDHNFEILYRLDYFRILGYPIMVGISRKSMIRKKAGEDPEAMQKLMDELHREAIENGASILRVHEPGKTLAGIR